MAGLQAGATLHAHGASIQGAILPREVNQPQGEPEPELPGATDPSESEQASGEIGGESDSETLHLNQDDGSDAIHTDTDPYEDPTSSQAEVEQTPDVEYIDIEESPDEFTDAGESETISEQASTRIKNTKSSN